MNQLISPCQPLSLPLTGPQRKGIGQCETGWQAQFPSTAFTSPLKFSSFLPSECQNEPFTVLPTSPVGKQARRNDFDPGKSRQFGFDHPLSDGFSDRRWAESREK